MPLAAGSRLGPYEILAPLGAGGMGEVYRARDTRLGREVAIKVLPQHLSSNPEIRARFEREAKTVSSLNHPHICTLFDVGREGETDYLVMELVEGETLAQRLTRGPLPAAEVLKLGEQIADALDRAHRAGVIHRDLKPGNVMLTRSGGKLMDFGLARATGMVGPGGASGSTVMALTQSPTIAQALTAEGTLIGTFQYMSPEQLEGKEADARSDLWSFGAMLYEMVSGRRAFEGRSQASLIAAILERQPEPLSVVAPKTSAMLEAVVVRCLAKDPDDRWQNARDLMHELRVISGASLSGVHPPAAAPAALRPSPWAGTRTGIATLVGGAALAAGVLVGRGMTVARAPEPPLLLTAAMPANLSYTGSGGDLALSPDGRAVAFIATDTVGTNLIWIRPLDQGAPRALAGTQNAFMPFWSPDSRSIAFFSGDKLRKVAVAGGNPEDVCPAASGRGGSWGRDGVILFAPGAEGPIYRVSDQGGTPQVATAVDTARHEIGHRFPRFLPDGRRFFYATTPAVAKEHEIFLATIGSKERRFVLRCDGVPEATADGWLLFRRNGVLQAQRFDAGSGRLSGSPTPLIGADTGIGFLAAPSAWVAGRMLVYLPRLATDERLVWVDRKGTVEPIRGLPAGGWFTPRLSPDGTRAMAGRATPESNNASGVDLWSVDLGRGLATRLTFEPNNIQGPVWSPDGRTLLYASNREGAYALYLRPASGGGEPQFVARAAGLVIQATDWSRDSRFALYQVDDARTASDVWLLDMQGAHVAKPLLQSSFSEHWARISPDGQWVAYVSDESGRSEVYVQSFPGLGSKQQVSTAGGSYPYWRSDGREILFRGIDNSVMSSPVEPGPSLRIGMPVRLFRLPVLDAGYSVAPDAQRFLMALLSDEVTRWSPMVAMNWQSMIRGR
jgi:eukaryotic-like serine/threonine-protein kinase